MSKGLVILIKKSYRNDQMGVQMNKNSNSKQKTKDKRQNKRKDKQKTSIIIVHSPNSKVKKQ
jgi:hypothetical protein